MELTLAEEENKVYYTTPHWVVGISTPYCIESISSHMKGFFYACHILLWQTVYRLLREAAFSLCAVVLTCFRFAATISTGAVSLNQHRGSIMPNHTPKSKNTNTQRNAVSNKSQSRFNVITRSGRSIVRKVSFKTAINLKAGHPELIIKFDSMGAQS